MCSVHRLLIGLQGLIRIGSDHRWSRGVCCGDTPLGSRRNPKMTSFRGTLKRFWVSLRGTLQPFRQKVTFFGDFSLKILGRKLFSKKNSILSKISALRAVKTSKNSAIALHNAFWTALFSHFACQGSPKTAFLEFGGDPHPEPKIAEFGGDPPYP